MLKIEAIVRPEKASLIGPALENAGCGGYYLLNITGKGNQKGVEVLTGRGTSAITRSSMPKTLVVTVVDDKLKDKVINVIQDVAKTGDGSIGDGKIFISKIDEVVRVRTGEKGLTAL
jgi:nitrogen regulatory protein PII